MNNIRRDIGLKGGLYRRIKRGEAHFIGHYNELARKVKKILELLDFFSLLGRPAALHAAGNC